MGDLLLFFAGVVYPPENTVGVAHSKTGADDSEEICTVDEKIDLAIV